MMKHLKSIIAMLLALVLCLSLCACSGTGAAGGETENQSETETDAATEADTTAAEETEAPASEETEAASEQTEAAEAAETVLENGGMRLTIPAEFVELVEAKAEGDEVLFSVSEKASIEAAKKLGREDTEGAGWLFDVRKVPVETYLDLISSDMSGMQIIGKDASETYYVLETPTDVRVEREDMSSFGPESEDFQQWSALCEWAASVKDSFCTENGLEPIELTNTEVDICLNRLTYFDPEDALFRTLDYGEQPLNKIDSGEYLRQLVDGVKFEWLEYADDEGGLTQAPDGEYYCLYIPQDDLRLDFFKGGDGNLVRLVNGVGGAQLFRASYKDADKNCTAIVEQWLEALAAAE